MRMILANGTSLLWINHVVVIVIIIVVIVESLLSRSLAAGIVARTTVLLVEAATTWDTSAAAHVAVVQVRSSIAVADAFSALHDGLHGLLLRVKVRVQQFHQFIVVFFLEFFELLDLCRDGFAFSFVPNRLQLLHVEFCFGENTTECHSAAAIEKDKVIKMAGQKNVEFLTDGSAMPGSTF